MRVGVLILVSAIPLAITAMQIDAGERFAYRYKDDSGDVHIRGSRESIPDRFREKAVAMRLETIRFSRESRKRNKGDAVLGAAGSILLEEDKGRLMVEAKFNKSVDRGVLLDTGSQLVIITTKLASALGIDLEKSGVSGFTTPSGAFTAPTVFLRSITIGPATVENISAVVIDFPGKGKVSAVIGMNFLSHYTFRIDTIGKKLTFTGLAEESVD